jgi:hypothetical protein
MRTDCTGQCATHNAWGWQALTDCASVCATIDKIEKVVVADGVIVASQQHAEVSAI